MISISLVYQWVSAHPTVINAGADPAENLTEFQILGGVGSQCAGKILRPRPFIEQATAHLVKIADKHLGET